MGHLKPNTLVRNRRNAHQQIHQATTARDACQIGQGVID